MSRLKDSYEKYNGADLIMHDFADGDDKGNYNLNGDGGYYSQKNTTGVFSGAEFLKCQEMPWVPWLFMYRTKFLNEDLGLRFVEKVRFEDVDFVMAATIDAKRMAFVPKAIMVHTVSPYQTSTVGNSVEKITDLFKIWNRVGNLARKEMEAGKEGAETILGHHVFGYTSMMKKYGWRLPYKTLARIFREYPPSPGNKDCIPLKLAKNQPILTAAALTAAKPFLHITYYFYTLPRKLKTLRE